MNKSLIYTLLFILGIVITCLSVKADNLSKTNSINDTKKCKTMKNGVCTEYFDVSNKTNCGTYFGIGFNNNDTSHIITHVLDNSSAANWGMAVGNKLVKINGEKLKGYETGSTVISRLNSLSVVNLEYKDNNGQKREVTLNKTQMCIPVQQKDELFETYWRQICPISANIQEIINMDRALLSSRNVNYYQKQFIGQELEKLYYWNDKHQKFLAGYKTCKYSNGTDIHSCLTSLVDRELQQIAKEQEYARQQAILQAQQQMQQQQVNAMNNYSHALRNQHVQVDTNVYHNGTVNHNVNQNVNFNGTIYHY